MLTVTGSQVTALKNAIATVNTSNYTNVNGVITISKAYLATLTTGDKTFTCVTSDGTNPTCVITVVDTTV